MQTQTFKLHKEHRLLFAVAGACCAHFLVFWLLHTGIWWDVKAAHEQRVLTLSLVSGELDQERESATPVQATQDQVQKKQATNLSPRTKAGSLSAAAQLNPEGRHLANPEPDTADSVIHQQMDPINKSLTSSPTGALQAKALQSSAEVRLTNVLDAAHSPQQAEVLHTSDKGGVVVATTRQSAMPNQAESIQVTESEQRMLDQKLQHWAQEFADSDEVGALETWQELGQTYEARFTRVPASGDMDLDQVAVEVRTQRNGQAVRTSMRLQKLAFSNFGQFVHRWDPNVSMHDDEVSGRFHSNSRFNLDYTRRAGTVFSDKVTTAARRVNFSGPASKQQVFKGGLETGVQRIAMPQPVLLFERDENQRSDAPQTHLIEQDTSIRFLSSGRVELLPMNGNNQPIKTVMLADNPVYFIADSKVVVGVQGVVNGAVAVYSPRSIVIEGNLVYQSSASLADGGDFLGLISARNIVVPGRKKIGQGDLEIHAALYARRRFVVTQAEGRRVGTLRVFGSVSAGSLSITEPRYATRIDFDRRLETLRPPGFPVTSRYELMAHEQTWELQSDDGGWAADFNTDAMPQ
ncbi:hypothetical protein GCM10008090_20240 [Arenicella chitinivorans]|uniref:Uncharacterized protein n=1 Tax=Arenicella chitinivorans TaxID=1329800 RepID=A0A918RVK8_9GAMM|nr:hypothetical protein [Arenicella chitinivorans]GHA10557.1 hypothetical protein GCM10008090_20240 [Arenicella chitinivorans]